MDRLESASWVSHNLLPKTFKLRCHVKRGPKKTQKHRNNKPALGHLNFILQQRAYCSALRAEKSIFCSVALSIPNCLGKQSLLITWWGEAGGLCSPRSTLLRQIPRWGNSALFIYLCNNTPIQEYAKQKL